MRGLLSSPRRRRRLTWAGGALALVAAIVALGVLYPNTAAEERQVFPVEQAYVYKEPKRVELTNADRARALATAANFVTHAVARRGVDQAFDLTAPSLRGGITRTEWRSGNIPVVPFPVDEARWKLEYSYEDAVGLQVLLFPPARSGLRPELFNMELAPAASGGKQRFLVTSWSPNSVGSGGVGTPRASSGTGVGGTRDVGAAFEGQARLDARWLLVPVLLFSLVPLVVIGYFLRGWLRGRRAAAAYGSAATSIRDLPTLRR